MTAAEQIFGRIEAAVGREGDRLENGELAALRQVLLAPERGQIKKILHRLDDPATRAAEIAGVLPEAIALGAARDQALVGTLAPAVRQALGEALRERPDLLVGAMRGAIKELLRRPWRAVGRIVRRNRKTETARLEQMYLISRETGELLDKWTPPPVPPAALPAIKEEWEEEEARRVASMVTYLLSFLRDPEQLAQYAALGQLRIERFTYGIAAGAGVVLLAVIRGQAGAEDLLEECRARLMRADDAWLQGERHPTLHDSPPTPVS